MKAVVYARSVPKLARRVARELGVEAVEAELRVFPDKEHKPMIPDWVSDGIVVQSTGSHDDFVNTAQLLNALRNGGAPSTLVIPYYAYAREDRRFKKDGPFHVAVSAVMFHEMLASQQPSHTFAVDLHNPSATPEIKNLLPTKLFARDIKKQLKLENLVVCVPDKGAKARSKELADELGLGADSMVAYDKKRGRKIGETKLRFKEDESGDVKGKTVVIYDDMIAGGGTTYDLAKDLKARGAKKVVLYCTHGVLCGKAWERLEDDPIDRLVITDSIPLSGRGLTAEQEETLVKLLKTKKLRQLSLAPLIAGALAKYDRQLPLPFTAKAKPRR